MKVVIVGVTGLVGRVMLDSLVRRNFPVSEIIPVASSRSMGKTISFKSEEYPIRDMQDAVASGAELAIFSAGASVSKEWAPKFAENGTTVIDNSSAWRMEPWVKLIVPEVNAHELTENDKIIANPNCSTIQLVVALSPLHKKYGIKRLVISTYQSFTGTGQVAVAQYEAEKNGLPLNEQRAYPHPIFENCLPHCDVFFDNGYTKEEMKLVNETRKILSDPEIRITATAVRVPVHGGHSESVNVELKKDFDMEDLLRLFRNTEGLILMDDIKQNIYPMPLFAKGKDEVFVGRVRRDNSVDNGLNLWIVSDNLRKGAATNAIQIAEYLIRKEILQPKVHV